MVNKIFTDRLMLMPATYEIISLVLNNESLEKKYGLKMSEGWPTSDTIDIFSIYKEQMKNEKNITGFKIWLIVNKHNDIIMGDIGFKGEPNDKGEVEIGYGLAKIERRKGYGYEAVKAMMNWALEHEKVQCIKAECLIDNIPSKKILDKIGMEEIQRDNSLIIWELKKDSKQNYRI